MNDHPLELTYFKINRYAVVPGVEPHVVLARIHRTASCDLYSTSVPDVFECAAYSDSGAHVVLFRVGLNQKANGLFVDFQQLCGDRASFDRARAGWVKKLVDTLDIESTESEYIGSMRHLLTLVESRFVEVQRLALTVLVDAAYVQQNRPILAAAHVEQMFARAISSTDEPVQRLGLAGLVHMKACLAADQQRLHALALTSQVTHIKRLALQLLQEAREITQYSI